MPVKACRLHAGFICLMVMLAACSPRGIPSPKKMEARSNDMWDRIGSELASAAAKQPERTKIVLVRQEDRPDLDVGPGQNMMEASFKNELLRLVRLVPEIVVVSLAAPTPSANPMALNFESYRKLTPEVMDNVLHKHGTISLIVSLLGEPTAPPPADASWPPVICFSTTGSTNLVALIRSGVVTAAVAPRHTNPSAGEQDWFELRYTVLGKENIGAW